MSIVSAIVLYAVIWFMVFLVVLPLRLVTQGEAGEVVPGTHASSPTDAKIKRKALVTTGVALVIWAVIAGVIISGTVSIRDIDLFNRMGPGSADSASG